MRRTDERFTSSLAGLGQVWPLLVDYGIIYVGYFALLPLLPIIFTGSFGFAPSELGVLLLVFSLSVRGSGILLGGVLDRMPPRRVVAGSLLLTAFAFFMVASSRSSWQVMVGLSAAGAGISAHSVVARRAIAEVLPGSRAIHAFAALRTVINVGAAVGPLAGSVVFSASSRLPLLAASACYAAGAVVVLAWLPASASGAGTPSTARGGYRALLRDHALLRLAGVNALGWFLFAQLYSALPLLAFERVGSKGLAAGLFALNGLLVIGFQLPVTVMASRLIRPRPDRIGALLLAGVALFATSFLVIGATAGRLAGLYVGVILFTLAEMVFMPLTDTAYSTMVEAGAPTLVFSASKIPIAVGEALGALCGASLFPVMTVTFGPAAYWVLIGGAGLGAALAAAGARAGRRRIPLPFLVLAANRAVS